jgi:FkbM family methyltransferase
MSYSQNNEENVLLKYFGDFTGTLLDIGANDGKTFSNSLRLIELGWRAFLIEPSPTAFEKLEALHYDNTDVDYLNCAIGSASGEADYFDMGNHINQGDSSLLSTLVATEMTRWVGTKFTRSKVPVITWAEMCEKLQEDEFDFITIDAEGMDIEILKQIDLTHTRCVCIEYNNKPIDLAIIRGIVPERFKQIHINLENVIYAL